MGILISRYLDDEVSPEERDQIDSHIRECELCDDFWQVLQRNERLIQDALRESGFSQAVVANIEKRVEKAAEPHRNVKQFPRAWAAAAALLVGCIGVFAWQQSRITKLDNQIAGLKPTAPAVDVTTQLAPLLKLQEAEQRRACAEAVKSMLNHRPDGTLAYVANGVTVTAAFPRAHEFRAFNVHRRALNETDFGPALNAEPLLIPNWTDATAQPGQDYEYRFVGYRADATAAEGTPVRVHVPGEAAAAAYPFELRLVDIREDVAVAVLTPREGVAGAPEILHLRIGETVAGFTVDRFENGDELLTATLAWPQADEEGRPVIDPATGKVKVKYEDTILSVRANQRMILRRGDRRISVWRQGRVLLPS